jgi:cold-inducible RNA-binding protein
VLKPLVGTRLQWIAASRFEQKGNRSMATKLYVGNLNYQTTEDSLREAFSAEGRQVTDVFVVTDRATGQPRGFAFVEMASDQDAQSAINALNGQQLDGRTLRVSEAREREPRGPGGGGGGGGRGGFGGNDRGGGGGRGGGDRSRGNRY